MSTLTIWTLISLIALIPVCALLKGGKGPDDFDDRDPYA